MLTHFSLFTGIGGIDLAAEWAGFETVGQCEFADYPTRVLEKHWPDVPRWRDIRTVTKEGFYEKTGLRTVDLISGGFPCQPFSVAGKQRGKEDDRYLWPEMLRVIEEIRPTWVLGENVAGIVRMALDQVLFELENKGYTALPFIIPACSVDAPHRRERVFIIAHSNNTRNRAQELRANRNRQTENERREKQSQLGVSGLCKDVADAKSTECKRHWTKPGRSQDGLTNGGWWAVEPDVGRVANGIPNRVDRVKCLGNAVVPQQVHPILKAIAEIEKS